jgi:hypothetical protein
MAIPVPLSLANPLAGFRYRYLDKTLVLQKS